MNRLDDREVQLALFRSRIEKLSAKVSRRDAIIAQQENEVARLRGGANGSVMEFPNQSDKDGETARDIAALRNKITQLEKQLERRDTQLISYKARIAKLSKSMEDLKSVVVRQRDEAHSLRDAFASLCEHQLERQINLENGL